MEQIDPYVYVFAGAYKAFFESNTKLKFCNDDIDKNIKSFQKIRRIIDFDRYLNMLCELQRKCNKSVLKTITPQVLEHYAKIYTITPYYAKIYKMLNNEEK